MLASSIVTALRTATSPFWGNRVYDSEPPNMVLPMLTVEELSWSPMVQGDGDSLCPSGSQFGASRRTLFQVELYEKSRNQDVESAFYSAMNSLSAQVKLTGTVVQHESSGFRLIHTYEIVD